MHAPVSKNTPNSFVASFRRPCGRAISAASCKPRTRNSLPAPPASRRSVNRQSSPGSRKAGEPKTLACSLVAKQASLESRKGLPASCSACGRSISTHFAEPRRVTPSPIFAGSTGRSGAGFAICYLCFSMPEGNINQIRSRHVSWTVAARQTYPSSSGSGCGSSNTIQ